MTALKVNRFRLSLVALLLVAVTVLVIFRMYFLEDISAPSVELLSGPLQAPVPFRDKVELTLSTISTNALLHRAQNVVFGQRKTVTIDGSIYSLSVSNLQEFRSFPSLGRTPFFISNGLEISFLPGVEIDQIQKSLLPLTNVEMLGGIRMIASDGHKSSMFMGQSMPVNGGMTDVGQSVECIVKLGKTASELLLQVLLNQAVMDTNTTNNPNSQITPQLLIQTNLHFSVKLGIPKEQGVLLLSNTLESNQGARVILLKPLQ